MAVPRRQVIREVAKALCLPNPETITYQELEREIDAIPVPNGAGIDPTVYRNRLANELDGARPAF